MSTFAESTAGKISLNIHQIDMKVLKNIQKWQSVAAGFLIQSIAYPGFYRQESQRNRIVSRLVREKRNLRQGSILPCSEEHLSALAQISLHKKRSCHYDGFFLFYYNVIYSKVLFGESSKGLFCGGFAGGYGDQKLLIYKNQIGIGDVVVSRQIRNTAAVFAA